METSAYLLATSTSVNNCYLFMLIHFLCLCPLRLAIMLNFNISKVAYLSGLDNNIKQSDF